MKTRLRKPAVPPVRLVFSCCRLLPPREIAKSFLANGMIGRGGGDRNCIPHLQVSSVEGVTDRPPFQLLELLETLRFGPNLAPSFRRGVRRSDRPAARARFFAETAENSGMAQVVLGAKKELTAQKLRARFAPLRR